MGNFYHTQVEESDRRKREEENRRRLEEERKQRQLEEKRQREEEVGDRSTYYEARGSL